MSAFLVVLLKQPPVTGFSDAQPAATPLQISTQPRPGCQRRHPARQSRDLRSQYRSSPAKRGIRTSPAALRLRFAHFEGDKTPAKRAQIVKERWFLLPGQP